MTLTCIVRILHRDAVRLNRYFLVFEESQCGGQVTPNSCGEPPAEQAWCLWPATAWGEGHQWLGSSSSGGNSSGRLSGGGGGTHSSARSSASGGNMWGEWLCGPPLAQDSAAWLSPCPPPWVWYYLVFLSLVCYFIFYGPRLPKIASPSLWGHVGGAGVPGVGGIVWWPAGQEPVGLGWPQELGGV